MDYAGCDPGPLGDRDTPPPSGDSELPVLKILVVDCKQGAVRAVRYSVDGNYCMTAGQDKSVKLWNPNKGIPLKTYSGHGYEVLDVKGFCDNSQLMQHGQDHHVVGRELGQLDQEVARSPGCNQLCGLQRGFECGLQDLGHQVQVSGSHTDHGGVQGQCDQS